MEPEALVVENHGGAAISAESIRTIFSGYESNSFRACGCD
jgi:hypothetical protein